ncbi:hypothetical protein Glove_19g366 [Diversispora epigaea]|uniref:Uncharacterized protein n=1 Tax=Diversispora epigaea TaxID=1348612 RepID=A0A397JN68_9GLOM|nr:hypothetical protein Glove_19g366 [Diversispora epigaea]
MYAYNTLRVILNVVLFSRMHVERSQEKFVKLLAFEGSQLIYLVIKLSNSNAADDLYEVLMDAIPPAPNQLFPRDHIMSVIKLDLIDMIVEFIFSLKKL